MNPTSTYARPDGHGFLLIHSIPCSSSTFIITCSLSNLLTTATTPSDSSAASASASSRCKYHLCAPKPTTMRRSGSASCMLRPKNSLSSEDLQRLATWVKAGTPPTTVLTVVDNHKLLRLTPSVVAEASPTSSSSLSPTSSPASPSRRQLMASSNCFVDRLYILSELQAHANSIRFLCADAFLFNESALSSAAAASSKTTANDNEIITNCDDHAKLLSMHPSCSSPHLPPSIILYLLWKDSSSAQSFADEIITDCVRRCLQVNGDEDADHAADCGDTCDFKNDEDLNCTCKRRRRRRRRSQHQQQWYHQEGGRRLYHQQQQQQQQQQQLTRIYVVVDRISPAQPSAPPLYQQIQSPPECTTAPTTADDDDTNRNDRQIEVNNNSIVDDDDDGHNTAILHHRYNCEVTLAKQLARAASTSSYLRERIDGITIGIASDNRATPGLEACMDAVERGAKERRRCAARQVGDGGGGGFFTWLATPYASASTLAKPVESNSNEEVDGDDDEDRYYRMRRKHLLEHIRTKSPERSPVAIVAVHPDDLERIDQHHHNHHHGQHQQQQHQLNTVTNNILQCRVSTEWNGNGECNSFTDRAMGDWREVWYNHRHNDPYACGGEDGIVRCSSSISSSSSSSRRYNCRPKVPRILRGGGGGGAAANNHAGGFGREYDDEYFHEPISTVMVIVFLVAVAAHVWNAYGDVIQSFLLSVFQDH